MDLRKELFEAVERCGLTAKELSQRSGVSEAQISRFRSGGNIAFRNFQKLVDGLPPGAFLPTSSESQTSEEIANELERLAQKVRRRVQEKSPSTSESTNSELQEALVITKCQ
jgi:transcriptional regulator with XRE-family HTH domain